MKKDLTAYENTIPKDYVPFRELKQTQDMADRFAYMLQFRDQFDLLPIEMRNPRGYAGIVSLAQSLLGVGVEYDNTRREYYVSKCVPGTNLFMIETMEKTYVYRDKYTSPDELKKQLEHIDTVAERSRGDG